MHGVDTAMRGADAAVVARSEYRAQYKGIVVQDGTLDTLFVPYGHRRCIKCKAVRENGRFPVEGSVPYRSPTNHHCDVCRSVASPDLASPANAPGAGTMPAQARERMKTRRDRNASASAAAAPEDSRGRTEAMQNIAAALAGAAHTSRSMHAV